MVTVFPGAGPSQEQELRAEVDAARRSRERLIRENARLKRQLTAALKQLAQKET